VRQYRCHLEQLVAKRSTVIRVNKQLQQDITERRQAQEQLLHNALHDGLTGLPEKPYSWLGWNWRWNVQRTGRLFIAVLF